MDNRRRMAADSMVTRFTPAAACISTCLPTATEPVSDTLRIAGEAMR